ncbi:MAG TPA: hypothetical protein VGF73_06240 [Chthoniobacterales bacterium]
MQRTEDFFLTAEELRLRRVKRRRLLTGAVVFVLLLVLALVLGRPASHAIKRWQARRHAHEAFAFIAQEKWNEAQKEATAAWQLAPNEPEAIRAVARFLSRVRQPQALEFWDRLAAQSTLNHDDLRDEAALALALGETGRAGKAIDRLTANRGREATPADWLLKAQLEAQRGAPNEGVADLKRVLTNPRASSREQLEAAVLELRLSATTSAQAEAWKRLEQISRGKDAAGLDALVLLAQRELGRKVETLKSAVTAAEQRPDFQNLKSDRDRSNGGNGPGRTINNQEPITATALVTPPITDNKERITASAAALAAALDTHPLAKTAQRLLAIDLRIHASPDDKEKLTESAIERWKNAGNDSLVALATWLNGKGDYQRELDAIPLQRSLQARELFLQHVDALGALGRWEEIRRLLEGEQFPLDPTIEAMYLARCYAQLGQQVAAENNWQRALEATGGDAQKLMTLADYAEKNGATKVAEQACDAALGSAPKLRSAWQGKLRIAQAERDPKKIHQVLAGMLKIWPNDIAIQNDEAYLRVLLLPEQKAAVTRKAAGGEAGLSNAEQRPGLQRLRSDSSASPMTNNQELTTVEQIAKRLVQRDPTSLPHRTLLALVYLKENRPATALAVYEDLNVPASALTPSALAVHAAVLEANGNIEDASKEASQIPRSALLPEEAALLGAL